MFELCKHLLDRVEVWTVRRQEQQSGADAADSFANGGPLVACKVVHDDDVTGGKRWNEELFDPIGKALSVDRLVKDTRCIDPIVAQRCDKSHRPPMAIRHLGPKPLADRRPTAQRRHVGLGPSLVNENQPGRINAPLILFPLLAPSNDL